MASCKSKEMTLIVSCDMPKVVPIVAKARELQLCLRFGIAERIWLAKKADAFAKLDPEGIRARAKAMGTIASTTSKQHG
eukprot:127811-Amphidinium_carterae.1